MHMTYYSHVARAGEVWVNSTHRTIPVSPNIRRRTDNSAYMLFFVFADVLRVL